MDEINFDKLIANRKQILGSDVVDDIKRESYALSNEFKSHIYLRAVLGFDIYKYSQYPTPQQILIPYIFKNAFQRTIKDCIGNERFFFPTLKTEKEFDELFIDTGDGGFLIFENPMQAIIFALYFKANIERYNSFGVDTYLREITDEITMRFALTFDEIYKYNGNYYGSAIINNARIMAKDRLDRFLVDSHANKWFDKVFNCFENISTIKKQDIIDSKILEGQINKRGKSYLFENGLIKNAFISKIGEITSKSQILDIYSVFVQAVLYALYLRKGYKKYTISLGNLHTEGISEK